MIVADLSLSQNVTVTKGDDVIVTCSAEVTSTITWSINDKIITSGKLNSLTNHSRYINKVAKKASYVIISHYYES